MLDKTIECDQCNKEMNVKDVKVKEVKVSGERNKRIWNCIHCKHEYLITITNSETVRLSKLIELDTVKVKKIHDSANLLAKKNRLSKQQMNKNIDQVERLSITAKANRSTLDRVSKRLINEYKKEM